MAMHLLREKQKIIYWAVAIVVIPAFVLVYSVGTPPSGGEDPVVMTFDGDEVRATAFYGFRRRVALVAGGPPVIALFGRMRALDDTTSARYLMLAMADAEAAGLGVSEEEIGTYIRNWGPFLKYKGDEAAFQRSWTKDLQRAFQIEPAEFKRGVREWLLIQKYLDLLDGAAVATKRSAYALQSYRETTLEYEQATLRIRDFLEPARTAFKALPEEERNRRVIEYFESHPEDPRFWHSGRWRVEFMLAPFAAQRELQPPTDAAVEQYYRMNAREFTDARGRPLTLADARPRVIAKLREERRRTLAAQGMDRFLAWLDARLTEKQDLSLEALRAAAAEQFKIYDLRFGQASDTPIPARDVGKTEALRGVRGVESFLSQIDQRVLQAMAEGEQAGDEAKAKAVEERIAGMLKPYREMFHGRANPMAQRVQPFESDEGFVRIRVLEYTPPKRRVLRDENGAWDDPSRFSIIEEIVQADAKKLAEERAAEVERKLLAGDVADLGPLLTSKRATMEEAPEELVFQRPGFVSAPISSATGFEVYRLVRRVTPSFESFLALKEGAEATTVVQMLQRQTRGSVVYDLHRPLPFQIHPGQRFKAWIAAAETRIGIVETRGEAEER